MTLHYRLRSDTPPPYSQLDMKRGARGAFSAPVPTMFPGPAGRREIDYFIRGRGTQGELIASVGDEGKPLVLQVETVELEEARPVYKSPWLWTGVGVAIAAAVAVPLVIVNRQIAVQPGNLGRDKLP